MGVKITAQTENMKPRDGEGEWIAALDPSVIWSGNYFHHTSHSQFSLSSFTCTFLFLFRTTFFPTDDVVYVPTCLYLFSFPFSPTYTIVAELQVLKHLI